MVVDRERDKDNIDICFNLEMTYVLGRYHTPYEFVVILDFSKIIHTYPSLADCSSLTVREYSVMDDRGVSSDHAKNDDQQQSRIRPASTMDRRRVNYLQELFGARCGRVWI